MNSMAEAAAAGGRGMDVGAGIELSIMPAQQQQLQPAPATGGAGAYSMDVLSSQLEPCPSSLLVLRREAQFTTGPRKEASSPSIYI